MSHDAARCDSASEVLERARADGVKFISLQFVDVIGIVKNLTTPIGRLAEVLERGIWFDGSSIEGFARIHESDMRLLPDPTTYRVLPWEPAERRLARLICDVYRPNGEPFEGDPRRVLKRALAQARDLGFIYHVSPEVEFFLFRMDGKPRIEPVPHDVASYFDFSPRDEAAEVRQDIMFTLDQLGIEVERAQHEVAMGQHEINFRYAEVLTAADNTITFKYTVKAIAHLHNLYATFMPKPIFGINGSGMHTHQSLFDESGHNLFYDPSDQYRLSKNAYHFMAGQLTHARALAAIVAPTVNSYKRLVPGYEAPVYICWAQINRSALIRIPCYSPGLEHTTRLELRCPDPSCNPYLAFAAMLAAGLDGIRRRLEPPPPVEEDVYHFDDRKLQELAIGVLPASLQEALNELECDAVLREALGEHVYEAFMRAKWAEWDAFRLQVTPWELERYLEIL